MPIVGAPTRSYNTGAPHTGGFGDFMKGAANLFTAGYAYPKSGTMGNEGDWSNPWGLAESIIEECRTDEFGNRVTDCPDPLPDTNPPCCPTGVTIKSTVVKEDTAAVSGYGIAGQAPVTAATIKALAKAQQLKIEAAEGKKKPFTLIKVALPAPGVTLTVDEPGSAPTDAAPVPLTDVPTFVHASTAQAQASAGMTGQQTALLAGGAFLAAFLLIRGIRS
jgi:hypothetical protein